MAQTLQNSSILVVNELDSSRKMLISVLRLMGINVVDEAFTAIDAFRKFQEKNHDIIIAGLINGAEDAIGLAKKVRVDATSPNTLAPIIATTGPKTLHLVDAAREVGITDLLQSPFTVDDVSARIRFALSMQHEELEQAALPQAAPALEDLRDDAAEEWPEEEEAVSLTDMLLDHYLKHHEIVLAKLKFAQDATKKSLDEVRSTHEKVRERDNTNIHEFSDFEKMWEEVIKMFLDGGLSENDIFEIEKLVTTVPEDIKKHYDDLSQQDKSFMTLVEGLNADAYKKAKARVVSLQAQPNPLNGKTADDYKAVKAEESGGETEEDFLFKPMGS